MVLDLENMGSFSTEWLALREPADHRARNLELLSILSEHLQQYSAVQILDLGCGTGANFRGISGALPVPQSWRLVDNDLALLTHAKTLCRSHGSHKLNFEVADLRHDLTQLLSIPCDLVTAAALFDLVSESWLAEFVEILSARRIPLYATLIFDGAMSWQPSHPADRDVVAAFVRHQLGDKGFGSALGPNAALRLSAMLERVGYTVWSAPSPWRLGFDDHALIDATTRGVAEAAKAVGSLFLAIVEDWFESHKKCSVCSIGHTDVLALPALQL